MLCFVSVSEYDDGRTNQQTAVRGTVSALGMTRATERDLMNGLRQKLPNRAEVED
jgi:hypothetical protein